MAQGSAAGAGRSTAIVLFTDAEQARPLLGQALATARELGLVNIERRSVQLLAPREGCDTC